MIFIEGDRPLNDEPTTEGRINKGLDLATANDGEEEGTGIAGEDGTRDHWFEGNRKEGRYVAIARNEGKIALLLANPETDIIVLATDELLAVSSRNSEDRIAMTKVKADEIVSNPPSAIGEKLTIPEKKKDGLHETMAFDLETPGASDPKSALIDDSGNSLESVAVLKPGPELVVGAREEALLPKDKYSSPSDGETV